MEILTNPLHLQLDFREFVMAVTRLKRKDRRNKARAANRIKRMKQLNRRPVIKRLENGGAKVVAAQEEAVEIVATQEEE